MNFKKPGTSPGFFSYNIESKVIMRITTLRDYYEVSAMQIICWFDQWAPQDLKNEFMDQVSRYFDLPESLDISVEDYIKHTVPMDPFITKSSITWDKVLIELSNFLSTDQQTEFVEDIKKDYDLDYFEDEFNSEEYDV